MRFLFIILVAGLIKWSDLPNKLHSSASIYNQKQGAVDTFKIDCTEPIIDGDIARRDTRINYALYHGHLIKSFDSRDRLRKKQIINLYENDTRRFFSGTEIYDTVGRLIYENKTTAPICWHCYQYTYDTMGHLITKTGFSSGEVGIKISYFYKANKLIRQITERAGEKREKAF